MLYLHASATVSNMGHLLFAAHLLDGDEGILSSHGDKGTQFGSTTDGWARST